MAAKIKLVGPRANFSGTLGKGASKLLINRLEFVNGVAALPGNYDHHKGVVEIMRKSHGAQYIPEGASHGTSEVHTSTSGGPSGPDDSGVQPAKPGSTETATNDGAGATGDKAGSTGILSEGDGHEHSGLHQKVKHALTQLDHLNDEHWNKSGEPSVSAVEAVVGEGGVTRAIINEVDSDLRRK